jgi:hypothetical protein
MGNSSSTAEFRKLVSCLIEMQHRYTIRVICAFAEATQQDDVHHAISEATVETSEKVGHQCSEVKLPKYYQLSLACFSSPQSLPSLPFQTHQSTMHSRIVLLLSLISLAFCGRSPQHVGKKLPERRSPAPQAARVHQDLPRRQNSPFMTEKTESKDSLKVPLT